MNHESPKAAANRRKYALVRSTFREWSQQCMVCTFRECTEVHEICNGPDRQVALGRRETWLALCRRCHDEIGDKSLWPVERQLAVKLLHDPEWFDPEAVNIIRGRDPDAITIVEISPFLKLK